VGIRATGLSGGLPFTVYFAARVPREMGGATVEWDFGDGEVSHDPRTYHTFVEPGLYTVQLTVWSADGSAQTAAVQVLAHYGG
jgi:PKD repeat protein